LFVLFVEDIAFQLQSTHHSLIQMWIRELRAQP